jgi:hypothetical protein
LVVLIPFVLLTSSALCKNTFAIPVPPQLQAKYSSIAPVIDGYLGSAEWNDTAKYLIDLTGDTDIETWLYVKHNATHIHLGLVVWSIGMHALDEFMIAFDEGDDGSHGSGSRDFTLTNEQEDLKTVNNSHALFDGCYNVTWFMTSVEIDFDADCAHENDHPTSVSEIEYWEGMGWVDDHWECEFAIPFVGNDAGASDVSDLSCSVTDTVGIKIQYYYPSGNYYYPAGPLTEIVTYADLSFPAPLVESCDASGAKKDSFNLYEDVRANGSGFLPNSTYDFCIVNDTEVWTDGMSIPARASGTATTMTSDTNGTVLPVTVWLNPSTVGAYDMIVDVNKNGFYDEGIDALDDNDEVTAGFVIPELPMLSALLLFQFVALGAVVVAKKRRT